MGSAFVIADAHGRADLVLGLLEQEGLVVMLEEKSFLSDEVRRAPMRVKSDVTVVQVGDLANCVEESIRADLEALNLVGPVIDLLLVGNHEHPHFGGGAFYGYWPDLTVKSALLSLHDRRLVKPSFATNGILVSHAGLAKGLDFGWKHADEADRDLREMWARDVAAPMFERVGRSRGGRTEFGGLLWSDWSEAKASSFPQIVGHTVGDDIRVVEHEGSDPFFLMRCSEGPEGLCSPSAVCIDIGAGKHRSRIAGAWVRDGRVDVVVYDADSPEAAPSGDHMKGARQSVDVH